MKSLYYIKQEYAIAHGYPSWRDLVNNNNMSEIDRYYDEVAKLYAKEAIKEVAKGITNEFPLDESN